ncbi:MAG: ATP-dependent helicase HrpB, partial [Bacteroidia bacterium]|nr:ATP-dependent helicase HrpB [Bacteroidia bacterium]
AAVIHSEGRMFDVNMVYLDSYSIEDSFPDTQTVATQVSRAVAHALDNEEGDILAFLPGEAEIRRCEELLSSYQAEGYSLNIYPLYGMLSSSRQRQAIAPSRSGERKVVLATSIAETSITIDGVRIVVDSGLCRQLKYSPNNGLSHLETVKISMDMANQRAGRAGRTQCGICYRLWSKASEVNMAEYRKPEILTADLTQLVLDVASWGESDINALLWLDNPPRSSVNSARELLTMLNAIDDNGNITPHGRDIQRLPCHPRISEMMLAANNDEERALAADIAAIIEERDPLRNEESVDINIRIDALRRHRKHNGSSPVWNRIEKIASQYRNILNVKQADNSTFESTLSGYLLAAAFPERIAASNNNHGSFTLTNGHNARLKLNDYLSHEAWIVVANLDARDSNARIFSASPIDPRDLAHRIREVENISWNKQQGVLTLQNEKRLGFMVISANRIQHPDEERITKALLDAIENYGEQLLDFYDERLSSLCARIASLAIWHPDENWPDVSIEGLKANAKHWLAPYLIGVRNAQDFTKLNLAEALLSSLDYNLQQSLERLAPTHIQVPSGSNIKLKYQANGNAPILAVRLQECFGMTDTPTVDNGTHPVLMHLLSPGYKPIQITQDMRSFWSNAYFEVRKELRSRYPKHVWPENPYDEEPTRRAKSQKNNAQRK